MSTRAPALSRRKSVYMPPWTIPKRACPFGIFASLHLLAHLCVRFMELTVYSLSAGYGVHSSRGIMTSAPSASCISIALSGVREHLAPSRCELNWTPSSVIFLNFPRLKTWKPPLSVSIGPLQFMKPWSPPSSLTSLCPGLRYR